MLDIVQQVLAVIAALVGLVSTGVGAFFTIKTLIKSRKDKSAQDNWELIQTMALAAMSKAEESDAPGADKKAMVIDSVEAGCKAAGIDVSLFLGQLQAFIDKSITFANTIH